MLEYRPNVAILLVRDDGKLLICERMKVKGAWQFPQGGVDRGETLEEALLREVREEVGLTPESYEVVEMKGGYRYLYPPEIKQKKKRRGWFDGQEQTYYLCRLTDKEAVIDVNQQPREFRTYKWIDPAEFQLDWLPGFKQEVYRKVMRDFFEVEL